MRKRDGYILYPSKLTEISVKLRSLKYSKQHRTRAIVARYSCELLLN